MGFQIRTQGLIGTVDGPSEKHYEKAEHMVAELAKFMRRWRIDKIDVAWSGNVFMDEIEKLRKRG